MGGVHTCRSLRNVQQICCSAQTGQHSRLQHSCCPVWALQHILVGRSYATDMYERWLLGIAPAIAVPSGRARANASAHVTFQRTTSERKLFFSAKLRRQRCCLAELCLQGILPACRPIHWPRPGARVSKKKTRASAHIKWLFSTKQVVSPVLTSATGAAFLVCARKQRGSAFARLRSHASDSAR